MARRNAPRKPDNGELRPVLVDTWAFAALTNSQDSWHQQSQEVGALLHAQGRKYVLTQWILTEFLNGAARPPARSAAIQAVQQWCINPRAEIIPATSQDWQAGFDLYRARPDQSWSLVDCISILVCQRLGITEVFTGDRHFEQAGLSILLQRAS